MTLDKKRGQIGIIPAVIIILGSIIFVSAAITNSTNDSLTSYNESFDVSVPSNNETALINLTLSLNETLAETIIENQTNDNFIIPEEEVLLTKKPEKNLTEIVEKNKHKLNAETQSYLKDSKDKKELKDYIVKFMSSIDEGKLVNVTLENKIEKFKVTKVRGEVEDIEDLIEDNEVEFLELDQNVEVLEENIPLNIRKVKADSAWNISKGNGVKVAVLDTGISLHDDLAIAGGVSFVDNNFYDGNGHGTAVAGVILALLNDEGLVGVSPEASLYSVKIMQSSTGDLSNAISGIEWAIDNNMDIVSMSFGFDSYSQIFKEALQEAYENNILLIAASGNNGQDNILYPAKYDTVIAVGAVDENNNLASFSSYGFEQELVADGVNINSTFLGNSYSVYSGTSMAAPHVAGVAALIKSFNKSLTNEQIRAKLRNDALDLGTQGKDDFYGYGLVQVNLQTNNFTITNLSYFYEIFNITDFGFSNQSYWFWLNGTGTIDDVDFSIGFYLVNITFNDGSKKSRYYYVDESGTLVALITTTMGYNDNYIGESSTTDDGVVWVSGTLKYNITTVNNERDAECFDNDNNDRPELCYYKTGKLDQCKSYSGGGIPGSDRAKFNETCSNASLTCSEGVPHNELLSTVSRGTNRSQVTEYTDCDNSVGQQDFSEANNPSYFVIDAKRAVCDGTVNYHYEGRYDTDSWNNYKSASCPTSCDSSLDEINVTSESGTVPSPCTPPSTPATICNGTISAIVTDSKNNPLTNVKVYSNNVLNGSVDGDGARLINYTNVNCGGSQSVEVRCNDNTVCNTKFASVDSNGDYDSLTFTCNICINKTDLSIKTSDVTIKSQGTKYNITAIVTVEKVSASNLVIDFRGLNSQTGKTTITESKTISVSQYVNQNVSVLWDINSTDFVSITADFNNAVKEDDETNNYVNKPTRPAIKAFIDVSTDYAILDNVIRKFLEQYVDSVSEAQAEVSIYVGRRNAYIPSGEQNLDGNKWKKENNIVVFNSKSEGMPYNGIVVRNNNKIYVFGNDVDGELAALRKLIKNSQFYLSKTNPKRIDYISKQDMDGLFVFDYLHTDENQPSYKKNDENFRKIVENVLNSDVSTLAIKRVLTANDNTSLRLKNINVELSNKYKNFSNPRPVVLGHGLFSNLFSMEELGEKIATDKKFNGKYVRDTWLIEYSGGPNTECSTCPNYHYGDLVDYYWTALIGGILKYSNQNKIDYVGYSTGGGIGIKSYERYYQGTSNVMGYYLNEQGVWTSFTLPANFVDNMALIAPIGALNGTTLFTSFIDSCGTKISDKLSGKLHLNRADIVQAAKVVCDSGILNSILIRVAEFLPEGENMSYNFWTDLVNVVQNKSDPNPKLTSINRLLLIYGALGGFGDDFLVPDQDISSMYSNSIANKKYKARIGTFHKEMDKQGETYDPILSKFLNNLSYGPIENFVYIKEES